MAGRNIEIAVTYEAKFDGDRWAVTWIATGATAYGDSKEEALARLDAAVDRLLDRLGKTGVGYKFLDKYGVAYRWLPDTHHPADDKPPTETMATYRSSKELEYA